jgi:hypothetical protein
MESYSLSELSCETTNPAPSSSPFCKGRGETILRQTLDRWPDRLWGFGNHCSLNSSAFVGRYDLSGLCVMELKR